MYGVPNLEADDLESAIEHLKLYGWRKSAQVGGSVLYMWNEEAHEMVALRDNGAGGVTVDNITPKEYYEKRRRKDTRDEVIFRAILAGLVILVIIAVILITRG